MVILVVGEIFNLSIFQKITYLFVFGCVESSLLCGLFSSCGEQGKISSCSVQASHWRLLTDSRAHGRQKLLFLGSRAQDQ